MKYYHYWYNDVISLPVTYAFCIDLSQEVCIHHSHAWNAPSTVHFRIHHFVSTQFCFGANCNKKICFVFCCIGSYSIWKVETFFASQHQAYIYNTYSSIILHYTCTLLYKYIYICVRQITIMNSWWDCAIYRPLHALLSKIIVCNCAIYNSYARQQWGDLLGNFLHIPGIFIHFHWSEPRIVDTWPWWWDCAIYRTLRAWALKIIA